MFQSKICCCLREKLVNFQLFWGRSGKVCRSIHFKSIHPAPLPNPVFAWSTVTVGWDQRTVWEYWNPIRFFIGDKHFSWLEICKNMGFVDLCKPPKYAETSLWLFNCHCRANPGGLTCPDTLLRLDSFGLRRKVVFHKKLFFNQADKCCTRKRWAKKHRDIHTEHTHAALLYFASSICVREFQKCIFGVFCFFCLPHCFWPRRKSLFIFFGNSVVVPLQQSPGYNDPTGVVF